MRRYMGDVTCTAERKSDASFLFHVAVQTSEDFVQRAVSHGPATGLSRSAAEEIEHQAARGSCAQRREHFAGSCRWGVCARFASAAAWGFLQCLLAVRQARAMGREQG